MCIAGRNIPRVNDEARNNTRGGIENVVFVNASKLISVSDFSLKTIRILPLMLAFNIETNQSMKQFGRYFKQCIIYFI